jgi:hypothetical protein
MKRRFVTAVLASVAALGVLSAAESAGAQELQLTGPLKGAPAVRAMRLYRQGRFELAPTFSASLLDEYRRTFMIGARLNYNITDWLAVGVWGGFTFFSPQTDLTTQIDQVAPRDPLTATNVNHGGTYPTYQCPNNAPASSCAPFVNQTAKLNWILAPQVTFIPFRGKLAIFNKIFVDADFYAAAGIAFIGISERAPCGDTGQPSCASSQSFTLQDSVRSVFSGNQYGTYALGFTFYPGDFWSIGLEYRMLPMTWNRAGFDSRGAGPNSNFPDYKINSQDDTFDFNQMITISAGFSFPTKPKISE